MRRWSLGKVLALLIVANLLLGGAFLALRPPTARVTEENTTVPQLPPQVLQLQEQLAQERHGEPYSLTLSDAELTALVGYVLANRQDIPFTGVRIAVTGEKVVVDGVTKGLAVTLPVRVTGIVGARDGLPWARVEDVSLGQTALPGFVRDQIIAEANKSLDFSRYPMLVTADAIELSPGSMTIRGTVK